MASESVDGDIRIQELWPVLSRWEGKTGHPRRMIDALVGILERYGFMRVGLPGSSVNPSAVRGATDFDGAAIFWKRGTRLQALWERQMVLAVGLLLTIGAGIGVVLGMASVGAFPELGPRLGVGSGLSVFLAIWLVIILSKPRMYYIGFSWRGETYQAAGRTEAPTAVRQAANVVSDMRLLAHAYSGFRDPLRAGRPIRLDPRKLGSDFQSSARRAVDEVEAALPGLIPEWD